MFTISIQGQENAVQLGYEIASCLSAPNIAFRICG